MITGGTDFEEYAQPVALEPNLNAGAAPREAGHREMAHLLRATPALRAALAPAAAAARRAARPPPPAAAADASSSAAAAAGVDLPDVRRLARLAQVAVSEEEAAAWAPQIAGIVDWFAQLQAADVEGVPPATRADVGDEPPLRPDAPAPFGQRAALLGAAADVEGDFVRVPRTTTGSEGEGS
jgi:aspartyl-tRNA(Asn)/glutamyl-tRNA(Gln) amidotransferase subunit C